MEKIIGRGKVVENGSKAEAVYTLLSGPMAAAEEEDVAASGADLDTGWNPSRGEPKDQRSDGVACLLCLLRG